MLKRVIWTLIIAGGILFALQGGEFSTYDLYLQRARKHMLTTAIDSLRRQSDSLKRELNAIQNDPETQERIAREEFGMVRGDKEILYRFAE